MAVGHAVHVSRSDRIYTRTLALTIRGEPGDAARAELRTLAGGDPHLLGRVCARFEQLVKDQPDSAHAKRALALTTDAWIAAISER